jgi:soluble lytic murein transglycosylase-like protein
LSYLRRRVAAGTFSGMAARLSYLLLLAAIALPGLARADIFAFTDSNGVTHFSNVPADGRFKLLLSAEPQAVAAVGAGQSIDWLSRSAKYEQAITGAAKANTIQAALVRAVIVVESGFNPRAVSKKGAVGLMQLQPATARRYGVKDIYDPEQNIRAGAHYLSDLLTRFDSNLELALAAYNAGEEAVERYGRHVPPFRETMSYVPSVMKVYQRLLDQAHAS